MERRLWGNVATGRTGINGRCGRHEVRDRVPPRTYKSRLCSSVAQRWEALHECSQFRALRAGIPGSSNFLLRRIIQFAWPISVERIALVDQLSKSLVVQ